MSTIEFQNAKFLTSAAELEHLPPDTGVEVAFAGRSNAGKSSTLNAVCQHKGLAKTSKTPGRTQLINFFALGDDRHLVDLPGYGYAAVSREIKQRWQVTLSEYLQTRQCLRGLVLVMDIRHPVKEYDQNMLEWAVAIELPTLILLNKADKLSRSAAQTTLNDVQKQLGVYANISVQLFSATHKTGLAQVQQLLSQWLAA